MNFFRLGESGFQRRTLTLLQNDSAPSAISSRKNLRIVRYQLFQKTLHGHSACSFPTPKQVYVRRAHFSHSSDSQKHR